MSDAIGSDLMALVAHLYRRKQSAAEALAELALRTREKCERSDVTMAPTAKEIAYTRWFGAMKGRFKALRDDLQKRQEIREAEEVIVGLYQNGCAVSQLTDAFSTATDMMTFRIAGAAVSEAASSRCAALQAKNTSRLTAKELAKEFTTFVVLPSLIPSRWWETVHIDPAKKSLSQLTTVGLRVEPPSMVLQYTLRSSLSDSNPKKRHRTIYLHEDLTPSGSVVALSKRLAVTHGAFLSDVDFQKYLLKLQKLMREGPPPKPTSTAVATPQASPAPVSAKGSNPNKADLGLLYRDPDAALKDVDLQDADEFTVKEFKKKMDETFVTKVLKPGDPGYQYDRRVEFKPTKEKSEWDSDDDDEDDEDDF